MKNKRKILFIILEIVFLAVIIFSGYKIFNWYMENKKTSEVLEDISRSITVDENNNTEVNFETLKEKNPDTVGVIKLNGIDIHYPVVQTSDNEYYLTHSYDKTPSSAGWIFADYRNNFDGTDKNLIIYGHNRRDGSMFSPLKDALNEEWYENEDNKYITFITDEGETKYEVFSVYQIEEEDYYLKTSFSEKGFNSFIKTLQKRSIKDFNVDVTGEDQILTLSTCSNNNKYRIVIHAKKTEL